MEAGKRNSKDGAETRAEELDRLRADMVRRHEKPSAIYAVCAEYRKARKRGKSAADRPGR